MKQWRDALCGLGVVTLLNGCARFESKPLLPADTAAQLDARSLEDHGLRQFIDANSGHEVVEWPVRAWDFPTLTLVAFYYHPSLDVARAQWRVANATVKTAGGRPNPILSVTPGYSSNPPKNISPWFPSVSIDVPIETAGKRQKRITRAEHLSAAARLNILTSAWQVRSQLRGVLLELAAMQRRAGLLQSQLELQDQLVQLLEQRLAAGAIAAAEVTPARVARFKIVAELAEARRQQADARVRLGETLGLPAKVGQTIPLKPAAPLPPDAADKFLTAEARAQALQSRPDVLASLAEYAAAESALQLEIAKQYPDVHLSPGYQWDQGENKWSIGLSMELPLLNRNQGPIGEADAKRAEAAARFLALQAKVIAEIDRAVQGHAIVSEQLRNSESLLQAQRKQADAVQAAFLAGGADRFEASSARFEAAVAELAVLEAETRSQQALGQLEDALQIPFEALQSVEQVRSVQAMKENIR